jgi:hypothetical protein
MNIRLPADNDLDERIVIATGRLQPAIDFQTTPAAGLHHLPDDQVLTLAAQQGRMLVSHDRRTMPGHFERFIVSHTSPGLLIVSRKLPLGRVAEWRYLLCQRANQRNTSRQSIACLEPTRVEAPNVGIFPHPGRHCGEKLI